MNAYFIIKTIHILSSVLLVGTGFGSAFYLFFANRIKNIEGQAVIARLVIRADWWFTTPAVIIQPISGFVLVLLGWLSPEQLLDFGGFIDVCRGGGVLAARGLLANSNGKNASTGD